MKSICFFNNKGGVGKTTLLCNVAAYMATEHQLRVLVVDADPQCNATLLLLGETRVFDMYKNRTTRSTTSKLSGTTVTSLHETLRPFLIGEAAISSLIPVQRSENNFRVDLLPGDPKLSLLEDQFSQSWLQFQGGDVGAARRTNWNTQLCQSVAASYDVIFFDVGPSLGALNRSVLIGVNYFLTPMGADVFSLSGIANISTWLKQWQRAYQRGIEECVDKGFQKELDDHPVQLDLSHFARFIGYTIQQYITKSIGGVRRATKAYEAILKRIPSTVASELAPYLADHLKPKDLHLSDVPHMFSLVPLAQDASKPIHLLDRADGLVGAQFSQKIEYEKFIKSLTKSILSNAGLKGAP